MKVKRLAVVLGSLSLAPLLAGCGIGPCGSHQEGRASSGSITYTRSDGTTLALEASGSYSAGRSVQCGSGACPLSELVFNACSPGVSGGGGCVGTGRDIMITCRFRDPDALYRTGTVPLSQACSSLTISGSPKSPDVVPMAAQEPYEGTFSVSGIEESGSATLNLPTTTFVSNDGKDQATLQLQDLTFTWGTVADSCPLGGGDH